MGQEEGRLQFVCDVEPLFRFTRRGKVGSQWVGQSQPSLELVRDGNPRLSPTGDDPTGPKRRRRTRRATPTHMNTRMCTDSHPHNPEVRVVGKGLDLVRGRNGGGGSEEPEGKEKRVAETCAGKSLFL